MGHPSVDLLMKYICVPPSSTAYGGLQLLEDSFLPITYFSACRTGVSIGWERALVPS